MAEVFNLCVVIDIRNELLFSKPIDDASHYVHESATNGSHPPAVYNGVQRRVKEKHSHYIEPSFVKRD